MMSLALPNRSARRSPLAALLLVSLFVGSLLGSAGPEAVASEIQSFTLESPNAESDGFFGLAVDVDSDRLIVGAPNENGGIGRAYVFVRSEGTWALESQLDPSDATPGRGFGRAVALRGDIALVGAPLVTPGAVYVFRRNGSTWNETRQIRPSDAPQATGFGWSVDFADAFVVVGSPLQRPGAVYVFEYDGSVRETKIRLPKGSDTDRFGDSVSESGDRFAVGAPGIASSFVYRKDAGSWVEEQAFDELGGSAALNDDVLVIAQPTYEDPEEGTFIGAYRIFERKGELWSESLFVRGEHRVPGEGVRDIVGHLSAAAGGDLAIGSIFRRRVQDDDRMFALVHRDPTSGWPLVSDLTPSGAWDGNGDRMSLATDGDTIVLGDGFDEGAVYGFVADSCRPGTVRTETGSAFDVLFVNGSAGDPLHRAVEVDAEATLFGAIVPPPGGGSGRFFVQATHGDEDVLYPLPFEIGNFCFPILAADGADPVAVWNALGRRPQLGANQYFGTPMPDPSPAPEVFLVLNGGDAENLPPGSVLTLQGAIVDPLSDSRKSLSVTNAVTLEIR